MYLDQIEHRFRDRMYTGYILMMLHVQRSPSFLKFDDVNNMRDAMIWYDDVWYDVYLF